MKGNSVTIVDGDSTPATAAVSFAGIPGFTCGLPGQRHSCQPSGAAIYTDINPVDKASLSGFYRFICPAP